MRLLTMACYHFLSAISSLLRNAIATDKDIPGISCGLVGSSVFEWEVMLMLSEDQDSLYGGE